MLSAALRNPLRAVVCLLMGTWSVTSVAQPPADQPAILLADDTRPAHVTISWPTRDGKIITLEGERGYKSFAQRTPLGRNLECYAAIGGTRLNRGLGNPDGAGVLVGFVKADTKRPLFDDIADKADVTVTLDRVFMNQPVVPRPLTVLMHLKYLLEHLHACGLTGDASSLYITADPADRLHKYVAAINTRPGTLDGKGPDHGKVETRTEADGSIALTVKFPYAILRHTQDPYQRTNPGGFFEPVQFHIEVEVLPKAVADKAPQDAQKPAAEPATPPAPPPPAPKPDAPK